MCPQMCPRPAQVVKGSADIPWDVGPRFYEGDRSNPILLERFRDVLKSILGGGSGAKMIV